MINSIKINNKFIENYFICIRTSKGFDFLFSHWPQSIFYYKFIFNIKYGNKYEKYLTKKYFICG